MKKRILLLSLASICYSITHAQEQWEPQKQITGFIASEGEYFDNLKNFGRNYGFSLSEAGILASYQPVKNLTLKAVFVYRPGLTFDQMLNEANAEYKANDFLNIKVGRFLTPLSTMNTYYYSPVNTSATLPMITSFHEVFPLTMDAVSLNGKIGEDFKFGYDLFGGGFYNSLYIKNGSVGIFGLENQYFQSLSGSADIVNTANLNGKLSFGGGGHVEVGYQDYITLGFNMFTTAEEKLEVFLPQYQMTKTFDLDHSVWGTNLKLKYNNFQLLGEWWDNDLTVGGTKTDNSGAFVILSNTFGAFTPYTRFEYQNSYKTEYNRYTAGVNYKPTFETTFKLEGLYYTYKSKDLTGVVATVIYSF